MTAPMRVEIWSDVACPWCYVGTRRFERAVQETGIDVDVVYRSFELDPTVPTGVESPPLVEYLAHKFGDRSRVQAAHARLTEAGVELGIDFRWAGMRRANTFDCHRLLAWALHADGADKQRALKEVLLRAYFTDGQDVADHERPRRPRRRDRSRPRWLQQRSWHPTTRPSSCERSGKRPTATASPPSPPS